MKKEIKAEIWEIQICGSAVEMVHGNYQTITELYIPSEKIGCNLANKHLHCFAVDHDRYSKIGKGKLIKLVTIPLEFVERLKKYIKLQGKIIRTLDDTLADHYQSIKTTYPIKVIPSVITTSTYQIKNQYKTISQKNTKNK
jgi:hypothetical protein